MKKDELRLLGVFDRAIEMYAVNPEISHQEASDMLGINRNTLIKMRKNPNFWEKVYETYMQTFEGSVVSVLMAAVREAVAGNVQAQRLVLEHSGKLQKNINITIDSPFEKWLKQSDGEIKIDNAQDAEIVSDLEALSPEFANLPERSADNSPKHAMDELKKLRKAQNKAKSASNRNRLRRQQHKWLKRAKAVGIDPLPKKRPTAGQKQAWRDSIVAKELQMKASKSKKG
jgi:hypothetical protein